MCSLYKSFSLKHLDVAVFSISAGLACVSGAGANTLETKSVDRVTVESSMKGAAVVRSSTFEGYRRAEDRVQLSFVLPFRHESILDDTLNNLYNPLSSRFHKFMSGADFDAQFAPTQSDYNEVVKYAESNGLHIVRTHTGRTVLTVSGSVKSIETMFSTKLANYQTKTGETVYANTTSASVPVGIGSKVSHVLGLTNLGLRLKNHSRRLADRTVSNTFDSPLGSGSGTHKGGLTPSDIATAYGLSGVSLKGDGQPLALFELDGYAPSDIGTYTAQFGLPNPNLHNVYVDGFSGIAGAGSEEVDLDIELMLAIAPRTPNIYVYEAENSTTGIIDAYTQIADDYGSTKAASVSSSWGLAETQNTASEATENQIFKKMAAQGQSMFAAAGDQGAYDDGANLTVDDPASQPYVTGVGGTRLTTNGPGGAYVGETAWNTSPLPSPEGGGGGVSTVWQKPAYQAGFGSTTNAREVPDVSLNADPETGYEIYSSAFGGWEVIGGTSASSPIWAAFMALVNEQRAINGLSSTVGQANPALYSIAGNPNAYAQGFHDITAGNNLYYPAGPGYDDATGLGSFVGNNLLNLLSAGAQNLPQGTLHGVVTDSTGKPISGVTIQAIISGSGVTAGTATTGADGTYTLSLGAGPNYVVSADAPGFAGRSVMATVSAGVTTELDFQLLSRGHVYPSGAVEMISAPYDFTGTATFSVLFGLGYPLQPSDPKLYAWDPANFIYVVTPQSPADTLHLGQAYWVRFPTDGSWYLHREGVPANAGAPFRIALGAGWNQIGDPFTADIPVNSLLIADQAPSSTPVAIGSSSTVVGPLYRFAAGTGYVPLGSGDALKVWEGYWIHVNKPSTLVVPPPPKPVTNPL